MTTSLSPTTHDGEGFVCECDEQSRNSCNGEPFYQVAVGKRYCILHYPGIEKKVDFQKTLEQKRNKGDFQFQGVWFPDDVSFRSFTFDAVADFTGAHFSATADFNGALFNEDAFFMEVEFNSYVVFSLVEFKAAANFNNAKIGGDAYFRSSQFGGGADFSAAQFSARAFFHEAQFHAFADFSRAKFYAPSYFENTEFNEDVSFAAVVFDATVTFHKTSFLARDGYRGYIFEPTYEETKPEYAFLEETDAVRVSFAGANFKDGVSFRLNKFADRVFMTLDAAVFEKADRAIFHTTPLRPHWFVNVDARRFTFVNVNWDLLERRNIVLQEIKALQYRRIADAPQLIAISFRQLAVNAEENNRYEEAANFRYMAMDAKRIERGFVQNLFSLGWWYWALSGYGERVIRAFSAVIVIWMLFAVLYWSGNATWWQPKQASKIAVETNAGERPSPLAGQKLTIPDTLLYSVSVMALQRPEPLPANRRAKGLVLLETILGPLQAALLALAIRRKFMR